jgi:hypothetical protein
MIIQSSHGHAACDLDAYFGPPEATLSLLGSEGDHLPNGLGEPLQATELSSIRTPRTPPETC